MMGGGEMGKAISYCHDTYASRPSMEKPRLLGTQPAPQNRFQQSWSAKMARRPWCLPERWATGRT
jgi:hypothetical protein